MIFYKNNENTFLSYLSAELYVDRWRTTTFSYKIKKKEANLKMKFSALSICLVFKKMNNTKNKKSFCGLEPWLWPTLIPIFDK